MRIVGKQPTKSDSNKRNVENKNKTKMKNKTPFFALSLCAVCVFCVIFYDRLWEKKALIHYIICEQLDAGVQSRFSVRFSLQFSIV